MIMTTKEYKSFLCYRGGGNDPNHPLYASRKLADEIYRRREDLLEESLLPLLFEAERYGVDYYKAIPDIMSTVEVFIICICPGFFDDIIQKYEDAGSPTPSAFKEKAKTIKDDCITYWEIDKALEQIKDKHNLRFIPVLINGLNNEPVKEYFEKPELRTKLEEIFEYDLSPLFRLTNCTNFIYSLFDANCDTKRTEYLLSDTTYITNQKFKNHFLALLNQESIASPSTNFRHLTTNLNSYYCTIMTTPRGRGQPVPCRPLKVENNELDYHAYIKLQERYTTLSQSIYHISNAYINGILALKSPTTNLSEQKFLGCGFTDIVDLCQIKNPDKYTYWTLECFQIPQGNDSISVCALCFGILLMDAYVKHDYQMISKILNCPPSVTKENATAFLDSGLKLLHTLRDCIDFSWLSEWEFSKPKQGGTVNQTTLSVSTLLSTKFLSIESIPDDVDVETKNKALINRFFYVLNSITWLKEAATWHGDVPQWTDHNSNFNFTLTVFSLDAFFKFYKDIKNLLKYFESISQQTYCKLLIDEAEELKGYLLPCANYLIEKAIEICNISSNNLSSEQIGSLSKILRLYCDLFENQEVLGEDEEIHQLIVHHINNAKKIYNQLNNLSNEQILQCIYNEKFPIIQSEQGCLRASAATEKNKNCENYENCGHLITIDALIKSSLLFNDSQKIQELKEKIEGLLISYSNEYAENVAVKYTNKEEPSIPHYPMYVLYYYRIAVSDFCKYFHPEWR